MIVNRQLIDGQALALGACHLAQHAWRQSCSITWMHGRSTPEIGQCEVGCPVAAEGRAYQSEQRRVLGNGEELTAAHGVAARCEGESGSKDLSDERCGHRMEGVGMNGCKLNGDVTFLAVYHGLIEALVRECRHDRRDEQFKSTQRLMLELMNALLKWLLSSAAKDEGELLARHWPVSRCRLGFGQFHRHPFSPSADIEVRIQMRSKDFKA